MVKGWLPPDQNCTAPLCSDLVCLAPAGYLRLTSDLSFVEAPLSLKPSFLSPPQPFLLDLVNFSPSGSLFVLPLALFSFDFIPAVPSLTCAQDPLRPTYCHIRVIILAAPSTFLPEAELPTSLGRCRGRASCLCPQLPPMWSLSPSSRLPTHTKLSRTCLDRTNTTWVIRHQGWKSQTK